MKETTREWLRYAEADVKACKNLIDHADLTSIVAFHSQQAVEKCFKAIIEEHGLAVPRIHSVVKLFGLVQDIINFPVDINLLQKADSVYSTSRYPSDFGVIPYGIPSKGFALELIQFAQTVLEDTANMLEN